MHHIALERERERRGRGRGGQRETDRQAERERERDRQTERKSLVKSVKWNSSQTATVHHMQFLYKGTQHHQHTHTHMYVFMNINKHIHILPSSLADNILSYSSLRVSSLSFSILWQIMVTCFIVNNGWSLTEDEEEEEEAEMQLLLLWGSGKSLRPWRRLISDSMFATAKI